MVGLGLSQSQLADRCEVTREAASKWLAGESIPRPKKLKALAESLGLDIASISLGNGPLPQPVVAYRTKGRLDATDEATDAAHDLARHLRQLAPFVREKSLYADPVLKFPELDDAYIRKAALQARARIGLNAREPITREHLFALHHAFQSVLVPVFWSGDKDGHENALSVYLPESEMSWVVFNLNARNDDFNYWIAHELGHCYSLHVLRDGAAEKFAERFAQELLFPYDAALETLAEIRASSAPLKHAEEHAEARDISVVTVIRQMDRVAESLGQPLTGLENDEFWKDWNANRASVKTAGYALFGSQSLSVKDYVEQCERKFRTPVFEALTKWQHQEGGRSPAFIAATLNIGLEDAIELSHFLMRRDQLASGGPALNNAL
jgi:transcriptional regulator with XRE-family HTH domain